MAATGGTQVYADQLRALYTLVNPQKLLTLDSFFQKYEPDEKMFLAACKKYGFSEDDPRLHAMGLPVIHDKLLGVVDIDKREPPPQLNSKWLDVKRKGPTGMAEAKECAQVLRKEVLAIIGIAQHLSGLRTEVGECGNLRHFDQIKPAWVLRFNTDYEKKLEFLNVRLTEIYEAADLLTTRDERKSFIHSLDPIAKDLEVLLSWGKTETRRDAKPTVSNGVQEVAVDSPSAKNSTSPAIKARAQSACENLGAVREEIKKATFLLAQRLNEELVCRQKTRADISDMLAQVRQIEHITDAKSERIHTKILDRFVPISANVEQIEEQLVQFNQVLKILQR